MGIADVEIVTSSKLAVHGVLAIVQRKTFAPTPNPATPEVGLLGLVIVPEPLINVHVPMPTITVFPARVAVVAHTL